MKKNTAKKTASKKQPKMAEMTMHKDMDSCGDSCCGGCDQWGLAVLRVVFAAVFIHAGVNKLMDIAGTSAFFASLGFWSWLGPVVGVLEVLAGVLFLIGLWTKWAGYIAAIIMLVATVIVIRAGMNWYAPLFGFGAALALAWNGPGKWAIQKNCCGGKCC